MNEVTPGFFALTEITSPSKHVAYDWWRASGHQAENLTVGGLVYVGRGRAKSRRAMPPRRHRATGN